MNALEMIKKMDSATGHWSGYVKHLDRIIYKSDLPFYPDYIQEEETETERPRPEQRSKPKGAPEPKTSLGKMLGGLKIED
jgi:3'-5' exoribonuclease